MSEPAAKRANEGEGVVNLHKWIQENESSFVPPVCNKLMHGAGQLKVMFVGGPNVRKDYHIEEGEELFWMVRGDMVLKIMEKGRPKDVAIKEGEIFVLPGRIPHSPQRQENTVGLVIERERLAGETDGLRYYCPGTEKGGEETQPLWEKWFHCHDLGQQLGPVIKEYFASEQHQTGQPIPGTLASPTPVVLDTQTEVPAPFSLAGWVTDNKGRLAEGHVALFEQGEFQVTAVSPAASFDGTCAPETEAWLWQHTGESVATVDGVARDMGAGDSLLVRAGQSYSWKQGAGDDAVGFVVKMTPTSS